MRITNFRDPLIVESPKVPRTEYATVTCWTLFGLIEKDRRIFRTCGSWQFLDTGEYTPGFTVERLAEAYVAVRRLNEGKV